MGREIKATSRKDFGDGAGFLDCARSTAGNCRIAAIIYEEGVGGGFLEYGLDRCAREYRSVFEKISIIKISWLSFKMEFL